MFYVVLKLRRYIMYQFTSNLQPLLDLVVIVHVQTLCYMQFKTVLVG